MAEYAEYIGTKLMDLPVPAAILDRAVVKRNCDQMLAICDKLGVAFRPHIKTHKTAEATALMTGLELPTEQRSYVSIVVSTTLEAFHVLPLLKKAQLAGKKVNVLLGIPLPASRIPDLVRLSSHLGPDAVAVMIDHPAQLDAIKNVSRSVPALFQPSIFIKIDTGYHRAGVPADTSSGSLKEICEKVKALQSDGLVKMLGFYSHAGHSYGVDDAPSAFKILADEFSGLAAIMPLIESVGLKPAGKGFVLSVGATPTINSAWIGSVELDEWKTSDARRLIEEAKARGDIVEFHAGNYPILDMQQMATRAGLSGTANRKADSSGEILPSRLEDIGMTILAEVNSTYGERDVRESLVTAGCLALGREPCKSYSGWGVVSDWPREKGLTRGSGWYVYAIAQEHGRIRIGDVPDVPTDKASERLLAVGEKVRIWPNHACIAATNFSSFFVVDGDDETGGQVVREVWAKCRGW